MLGVFVVAQYALHARNVNAVESVSLASMLCGSAAACLAYQRAVRPWLCGLLVSGAFSASLLAVFVVLAARGQLEASPLIAAAIIAAASVSGAAIASQRSRRRIETTPSMRRLAHTVLAWPSVSAKLGHAAGWSARPPGDQARAQVAVAAERARETGAPECSSTHAV
ncbi:MAG TPA: hypothetical protein VFY39_08590 [Gammaproteobacteria bacterium]|nr:hypothetical protein [Gammaproteobacteria bacterium]